VAAAELTRCLTAIDYAGHPTGRLAACVLLQRPSDHRILTVWNKRAAGLCLPGGLVEEGETPAAAAVRELREEVGLALVGVPHDLVEVYSAPHESPRARADRVHVFAVTDPDRGLWQPRAIESGCPIAWLAAPALLAVSPFRDFYEGMFAHLEARVRSPIRE
jgi:ADP-ribose pyrophosphatase YjhB (NUDIX family)